MNKWTEVEKVIADTILERYLNNSISYDEAVKTAEKCGFNSLNYIHYMSSESTRRYNEDFKKYIGKVKEEALKKKFTLSEEELRLLRENPKDISLDKGIRDRLRRRRDAYEINLAKYYYGVAVKMMKIGCDNDFIEECVPLTKKAINEIRKDIE